MAPAWEYLLMIAGGIVCWKAATLFQRKTVGGKISTVEPPNPEKSSKLEAFRTLHEQHPDIIPAVPRGVEALEFQGWFEEANQRLKTWAVRHRSASDMALRIQLQKQINDLEEEHLRYGKTRSEQILLEHRHNAEISKLKLEKDQADDQREQIKERAAQRKSPPPAQPRRESAMDKMAHTFEEQRRERAKHEDNPEMQEFIDRYYEDKRMRLKEEWE